MITETYKTDALIGKEILDYMGVNRPKSESKLITNVDRISTSESILSYMKKRTPKQEQPKKSLLEKLVDATAKVDISKFNQALAQRPEGAWNKGTYTASIRDTPLGEIIVIEEDHLSRGGTPWCTEYIVKPGDDQFHAETLGYKQKDLIGKSGHMGPRAHLEGEVSSLFIYELDGNKLLVGRKNPEGTIHTLFDRDAYPVMTFETDEDDPGFSLEEGLRRFVRERCFL